MRAWAIAPSSSRHPLITSSCRLEPLRGVVGRVKNLPLTWGPNDVGRCLGPLVCCWHLCRSGDVESEMGGGCRRLENLIYSVLLSFARSRLPIITIPTEHADKSQVRIGLDTHYRYAVSSLSCDRREEIMFTIIHAHELYHYHHNWKASV